MRKVVMKLQSLMPQVCPCLSAGMMWSGCGAAFPLAFCRSWSGDGCGVAFLRLAGAWAEAMCGCWANLQNTHFCGLTRKN